MLIDARASLEEVSEALSVNLEIDAAAEDVDTLGGYLATIAGRLPARGELILAPSGIEFEIIDADPRRIKRVKVHPNGIQIAKKKPLEIACAKNISTEAASAANSAV